MSDSQVRVKGITITTNINNFNKAHVENYFYVEATCDFSFL